MKDTLKFLGVLSALVAAAFVFPTACTRPDDTTRILRQSFVFRPLNLIEQRTLAKHVRSWENAEVSHGDGSATPPTQKS